MFVASLRGALLSVAFSDASGLCGFEGVAFDGVDFPEPRPVSASDGLAALPEYLVDAADTIFPYCSDAIAGAVGCTAITAAKTTAAALAVCRLTFVFFLINSLPLIV